MRRLFGAVAALAAAGCVAANTTMLDNRTAIISARGSGYNVTADVVKKVLVEAATKAQANGYEYFQIVNALDASSQGVILRPGTTQSNIYGSASCTAYSCVGSASGTSHTGASTMSTYIAPGADVTVRFLNAAEVAPNMKGVFSAAAVLAAK
jgi:hypothetical protein